MGSDLNRPPMLLQSRDILTFAEKLPIGSSINAFTSIDPDLNASLTYTLVSGHGDDHNSLFTVDSNGTLRTATTFDYETNGSIYSIRVHVEDQDSLSYEGNFTLLLSEWFSKVTASDSSEDLNFGDSFSESGNYLAVGSVWADSDNILDTGAVYLYEVEINKPSNFLNKITAPDATSGDGFGFSVSQRGNLLAVGANFSDQNGLDDTGAVYIFQLEANGTANLISKFTAPDADENDYFGSAISRNGNLLAIAATSSDSDSVADTGAVYLYELESNGTATYLTKVTAPDAIEGDNFGTSISLSEHLLAVGANYADLNGLSDVGAVYLYKIEANNTATYLTKITASDGVDDDGFGYAVSVSKDLLAVGVPNILSQDDTWSIGAVYLYSIEDNGATNLIKKVTSSDTIEDSYFGSSVSLADNVLAIGAEGVGDFEGATYLYRFGG